jgi:hypothetical protein
VFVLQILRLEDAGWKRLCPKDAPVASGMVAVCKQAGYNVVESQEDFLVEPRRSKDLYALQTTYSRENFEPKKAEFDLGRLPAIPKQNCGHPLRTPIVS